MKLSRFVVMILLLIATSLPSVWADDSADPKGDQQQLNEREQKFEQEMSGAVLVGHFTTDGKKPDAKMDEERYAIRKVSKVVGKDNVWRFFVRIQYGELDLTVPMNLDVYWAENTPVITLTDFTIPALGTFSARVLIYEDRYAGTWQHGKAGGHLFGRVEREKKPQGEAGDAS